MNHTDLEGIAEATIIGAFEDAGVTHWLLETKEKEALKKHILAALTAVRREGEAQGWKRCALKVEDIAAEFGDTPKECLSIIGEYITKSMSTDLEGIAERAVKEAMKDGWLDRDALEIRLRAHFIVALRAVRREGAVKVGMLRQWLNEERITDHRKLVTNEDLEYWLAAATKDNT